MTSGKPGTAVARHSDGGLARFQQCETQMPVVVETMQSMVFVLWELK